MLGHLILMDEGIMKPIGKIISVVALGILISACSTSIRSNVARFHKLPPPSGESFLIVPMDEANKAGIEFSQYAGLVRARLSDLGYHPVTEGAPDLVVKMDFSISDGDERVRTRPGPSYGYFAFHHFHHPGGYWPGYGLYERDIYSVTVYSRKLAVDIIRADGEALFEGRAISIGRNNSLPDVMPFLVQSLFTEFPGESGATITVNIDVPTD